MLNRIAPDRPFCGLWSLWDMMEIKGLAFYGAVSAFTKVRTILEEQKLAPRKEQVLPLTEEIAESSIEQINIFDEACQALGARSTRAATKRLLSSLATRKCTFEKLGNALKDIDSRFKDDLKEGKLFAMDADDAKYYDGAVSMFGDKAIEAFPSISSEVDEAGKCLAVGRAGAAIFHLMRIVEIGLRALAPHFAIKEPKPDWGKVIRAIDDYLKLPKGSQTLKLDVRFLADASAQMHAVKLAWRNQTMHVDTTFSLDNARNIFDAVKALMQHLATQLSEPSASGERSS